MASGLVWGRHLGKAIGRSAGGMGVMDFIFPEPLNEYEQVMDIAQRKKEIDRKIEGKTATEADMVELSNLIEKDKKLCKKDKKALYNRHFQDFPPLSGGESHE